jgi:hypothetical protein
MARLRDCSNWASESGLAEAAGIGSKPGASHKAAPHKAVQVKAPRNQVREPMREPRSTTRSKSRLGGGAERLPKLRGRSGESKASATAPPPASGLIWLN